MANNRSAKATFSSSPCASWTYNGGRGSHHRVNEEVEERWCLPAGRRCVFTVNNSVILSSFNVRCKRYTGHHINLYGMWVKRNILKGGVHSG